MSEKTKITLASMEERKGTPRPSFADGRYVTHGTPRNGGLSSAYRATDIETGGTVAVNTHRKSLVCDDDFAVVTSFNWLSYKGDSRDKPRDERGIVFRKKHHVGRLAAEELELLGKGYSGARSGPRASVR